MVAPEEDEATPRSVTTGSSCSSCVKLFTVAMTDVDYLVPSCSATDRAQRFDREHLRRLRAFAYRMLGSRAEAEDIVQEAWLRFSLAFQEKDSRHLHRINRLLTRRFESNIGFAFRQSIPAAQVADAVDGLIALIDGYSWRFLVNPDNTDFEAARRICSDYVRLQLCRGTGTLR